MGCCYARVDNADPAWSRKLEGDIPEVYRWPYDYKDDGHGNDFIPQTVPLRAGEESH